jgi:hypothetical protein
LQRFVIHCKRFNPPIHNHLEREGEQATSRRGG